MNKQKEVIQGIAVSFFSIIAIFILLEVVTRAFASEKDYIFISPTEMWAPDTIRGWHNKPNYEVTQILHNQYVTFKTSGDGLRPYNIARKKEPGVIRVMLIGNSTVIGRSVNENQTIHYYLDSILSQKGHNIEVINAGVEGYATDQAYLSMKVLIPLYNPDYILYGLCTNDIWSNLTDTYAGLSKPMFISKGDDLSLKRPKENENIKRYGSDFSIKNIVQHSALYGFMRPYLNRTKLLLFNRSDSNFRVDSEDLNEKLKNSGAYDILSEIISRMKRLSDEHKVKFAFYAHPSLETVWPPYIGELKDEFDRNKYNFHVQEDILVNLANNKEIDFIEFVDYFLERENEGPFHLLPNDPHCNGKGYRLQAEVLSKHISKLINQEL